MPLCQLSSLVGCGASAADVALLLVSWSQVLDLLIGLPHSAIAIYLSKIMASASASKKRVLLKPYGWGAWGVAPDEALMRRVEGMLAGAVNAKEGLPKPPTSGAVAGGWYGLSLCLSFTHGGVLSTSLPRSSDGLHGDVDWDALAKHALLPPPRFKLPQALQKVPCSTTPYDRVRSCIVIARSCLDSHPSHPHAQIRCSRGMSLRDTLRSNGQQYHDGSVVDYVREGVVLLDVVVLTSEASCRSCSQ